jgi:hypothetical protein
MTEAARRYMGNSVPRKEDPALLTGHTNFTDDIRLPGMLHMALLFCAVPTRTPGSRPSTPLPPRNSPASWPCLRARIWPTSGTVARWMLPAFPATRSTSTNRPRARPTSPHRVAKSPPMYPTPSRETGQDNADEE